MTPPAKMPPAMASPRRQHLPGPALRLALAKLLKDAARAVDGFPDDPAGTAHFVRTRVKRLQSLSRLVPCGAAWRGVFLPPCRELKDLFAETRDATIVRALADKYAPGEAAHLRAVTPPDLDRARHLAAEAGELLAAYGGWNELEWKDVADRAVGTFKAARGTWKIAARKHAPDAAFHAWRRRVKRLLYQCEYLGGRARLVRLTTRVDRLGEILGEIQDVCMAEAWLADHRGLVVPPDLPRSKEVLRQRALKSGKVLFASKPRDFRRMLA